MDINGDTGVTGAIFHHYILKVEISNDLNQPLSGKTVSFRLVSSSGNRNWRFPNGYTATTDSNGIASVEFDLQASSEDSFNDTAIVEAECAGQTETFTVKRAKSLTLNCDKNILSAADEEYATLTATVKDVNNLAVPYTPVVFNAYSDSSCTTLVENLGRVVTDANGVATVDYYGKATGDLYIQASTSNIESNTIEIEDTSFYDNQNTDKTALYTTKVGTLTKSYSSNYVQLTGHTSYWNTISPLAKSNNFILEVELQTGTPYMAIGLAKDSSNHIEFIGYTNKTYLLHDYSSGASLAQGNAQILTNMWFKFKLKIENNVIYISIQDMNNNVICSDSASLPVNYQNTDLYPTVGTFGYGGIVLMRNFKIINI